MSALWQKLLQDATMAKAATPVVPDPNCGSETAVAALQEENRRLQRRLDEAATRQRGTEDVATTLRAEVELLRAKEATWRQLHPHLTAIAAAAAAVARDGPAGHLRHWGVPPPLGAIAPSPPAPVSSTGGLAASRQPAPRTGLSAPSTTAPDLETLRHALLQHRCVVPVIALGRIERDTLAAAPQSTAALQRRFVKNVLKAHFSLDLWRELALEATADAEAASRGRGCDAATQCEYARCPDPECAAARNALRELQDAAARSEATRAAEQRELQRMRTMLRFSVLKRDSDKLHAVEARADALVVELDRVKKEQVLEQHLAAYPSPSPAAAPSTHAPIPSPSPRPQPTNRSAPQSAPKVSEFLAPGTAVQRPAATASRADGETPFAGKPLVSSAPFKPALSSKGDSPPRPLAVASARDHVDRFSAGRSSGEGNDSPDYHHDKGDSSSSDSNAVDDESDDYDAAVEEALFAPGAAAAAKGARVAVNRWNSAATVDVAPHRQGSECVNAANSNISGRPPPSAPHMATKAPTPASDDDPLLDQALPSAADILREDELAERLREERRAALLAKLRGSNVVVTDGARPAPPMGAGGRGGAAEVAPKPTAARMQQTSQPQVQAGRQEEPGRATRAAIQAYFTSTRLGHTSSAGPSASGSADDIDGLLRATDRSKAAGAAPTQLQRWLAHTSAGGNHSISSGGVSHPARPRSAGVRMPCSAQRERPAVLAQPPAAAHPARPWSATSRSQRDGSGNGGGEMWRETYADGPSRAPFGGSQTSRTSTGANMAQRPPSAGTQRRVSSASAFSLLVQKAAATYRAATPQRS